MDNNLLKIEELYVNAEDKEILKGINLNINKGEVHVIMGPNGSGKTTTAISSVFSFVISVLSNITFPLFLV